MLNQCSHADIIAEGWVTQMHFHPTLWQICYSPRCERELSWVCLFRWNFTGMSAQTTCCRSAPKFARCWSGKFLPACPVSPACWGQGGRISSAPARVSITQCSLMQRIYITRVPQQYKLFNVSCRAVYCPSSVSRLQTCCVEGLSAGCAALWPTARAAHHLRQPTQYR